ncbi:MAG: shikimate dehydrogenase [Anaerolineae bacterium]|nr:shikimate dehydrogenase [Anaerolineae bacterium]
MDDTFAFIIHPIGAKKDVARKYPFLGKVLTEKQINFFCQFWPPVYLSRITGIRSAATGNEIIGWFVAAPYTPHMMISLPVRRVYRKIIQTGRLAEKLGARILGLGAFTAVVGDGGITVAHGLDIPVTTGDSYTVALAVQAAREASRQMGVDLNQATTAVVGATGAIGAPCSEMMADETPRLILVGKHPRSVEAVRERCAGKQAQVEATTDLARICEADVILSATSAAAAGGIIKPEHLKPGAVVCDVAVPPDVSKAVARQRDDVLVVEGGMVDVPGLVNFHFNFGYPPGKAYGCMAETMALALEGRYEDYTLGKHIAIERVREIESIANRHGFRLSGLRSFNREVTAEQIAQVRQRAEDTRRSLRFAGAAP